MHKTRNSLRSFRDKIYISHVCLSLVVILVPRPPILSILFFGVSVLLDVHLYHSYFIH